MIDWEPYGPIYSVAPGIKKIKDLPIIEYDEHEERYLSLKQKCKEWVKKPDNYNVIRGANYNDKGEIRGANYDDKGHTEVGDIGWMKYTKKVYNRFWKMPGEVTVK